MADSNTAIAVVVEDDAIIRLDAVSMLEDAGLRTVDAHDADAALPLLGEYADQVSLLFTDVDMPGSMNGFALARYVAERWPFIGILVASGHVEPQPGDLPSGAIFIHKPFSSETVKESLFRLVRSGTARTYCP